jgi:hypothetical protein
MVLVDTSVWIRSLANWPSYKRNLERLLDLDQVTGHELVWGELLIGDVGGRRKFLSVYEQLPQASLVPHHEVIELVRFRRLHGRGVGWIDIHLLASAIVGGMQLWTADPRFAAMAEELGVGYTAVSK